MRVEAVNQLTFISNLKTVEGTLNYLSFRKHRCWKSGESGLCRKCAALRRKDVLQNVVAGNAVKE